MHVSSLPISVLLALLPLLVPSTAQDHGGGGGDQGGGGSGSGGGSGGSGGGGNGTDICQQGGSGNDSYVYGLCQALQSAGFTQLANITNSLNSSTAGQEILTALSDGSNYTVFAPSDQAFAQVPPDFASNQTLVAEILSYHIVQGNFENTTSSGTGAGGGAGGGGQSSSMASSSMSSTMSGGGGGGGQSSTMSGGDGGGGGQSTQTQSPTESVSGSQPSATTASLFERLFGRQEDSGGDSSSRNATLLSAIWPNTTVGRTLLNATEFVQLEGNKSQVLVWTKPSEQANVTILNQISDTTSSQNVTVVNTTSWNNLFVAGIDGVLIPPGNLTTAINAVNDTPVASLIQQIQVPSESGGNETLAEFFQNATGITIFVPAAEAFTSEINQTIAHISQNQTALFDVVRNHYINGTTVYSPAIAQLAANASSGSGPSLVSAAGENLMFSSNETGLFVQSANGTSAQIVRPDILLNNGVVHLVDRPFLDVGTDEPAASAAYDSATAAAASSTTETGPVTAVIPAPQTSGGSGGGGSQSQSQSGSESQSQSQSQSQSESQSQTQSSSESQTTSGGGASQTSGGGGGSETATQTGPESTSTPTLARMGVGLTGKGVRNVGGAVATAVVGSIVGAVLVLV